jgi:hypothetical protein
MDNENESKRTESESSTQFIKHDNTIIEDRTFIPEGISESTGDEDIIGKGEEPICRRRSDLGSCEKTVYPNSPFRYNGRSDARSKVEKQSDGTPTKSNSSLESNGTKCSSCKKRERLRRKYSSFNSNAGFKTPCEPPTPPKPETGTPILAPVYSFSASGNGALGVDAVWGPQHSTSGARATGQPKELPCVGRTEVWDPRTSGQVGAQIPNRELVLDPISFHGSGNHYSTPVYSANNRALTPAYLPTLGFRTGFKLAMAVGKYWWKNKFR